MARLLEDIDWAQPVLAMPVDPAWDREIRAAIGQPGPCQMMAASSPWLRTALLRILQVRVKAATPQQIWLVTLVTSQENACRYCYGTARGVLRLMGLSPAHIDAIEREVKVAGGDPAERALLQFARKLSRSSPRPVRQDVEMLLELGIDQAVVKELAAAVVFAAFTNRFATFVAVPLQEGNPTPTLGPLGRLVWAIMRKLGVAYPRPMPAGDPPDGTGPFSELVELLDRSESARLLDETLRGAFASDVLPVRTKAWMFAVAARALQCRMCETGSWRMLEAEGISRDRIEAVLSSLSGDELDETEKILLPWVRETVHYQTETIQRKTHELAKRVDQAVLLEAIGVAALANSCARLSMLEQ